MNILNCPQKDIQKSTILAWIAAGLPFLTIHCSYLLAAYNGHVDWCVPYWDACTSISATGRQMPEKIIFKAGMIPAAIVTGFLWWHLGQTLNKACKIPTVSSVSPAVWIGLTACFFLSLYTLALGEEGDTYQRIRRVGITLSFAFTFLAQLLFTRQLGFIGRNTADTVILTWHRRLLILLIILLVVGIGTVFLDALLGDDYDNYEDAFEWVLALLLNSWFAGLALFLNKTKTK